MSDEKAEEVRNQMAGNKPGLEFGYKSKFKVVETIVYDNDEEKKYAQIGEMEPDRTDFIEDKSVMFDESMLHKLACNLKDLIATAKMCKPEDKSSPTLAIPLGSDVIAYASRHPFIHVASMFLPEKNAKFLEDKKYREAFFGLLRFGAGFSMSVRDAKQLLKFIRTGRLEFYFPSSPNKDLCPVCEVKNGAPSKDCNFCCYWPNKIDFLYKKHFGTE